MQEENDMLFLLEHFSLEDLVEAEEQYMEYQCKNTDNLNEVSYDRVVFNEDNNTITETIYNVSIIF